MTAPSPLAGRRVVDLSTWIAGGYCTKLLADGGAEVIKAEPPDGDPLRRWSASGADIAADGDGALFNFLAASKQSIVVDPAGDDELAELHTLIASADSVVWSPGSALAEHPSLAPAAMRAEHPSLVVTAITPFGLDGPWSDRPATEFTLQAWSGGIVGLARGNPDDPPVHVGGQIGEWLAGAFAAVGTLAARRMGGDGGDLVDVSMLEASATCLTYYPVTYHDQFGRPMRRRRFVPTPGVGAASDGLVGLGCGTGQQWLDFATMVGHPEWHDDPSLFLDRTSLAPTIDAWIAERTVEEVRELASAFRIPNAPVVNGENATTFDHFAERDTFTANPRDGAVNPRPPYRLSTARLRPPEPAPALGAHTGALEPRSEPSTHVTAQLAGIRVLDMTGYWAGPFAGHLLAMLGAEVIHLESPSRPDGVRFVGGVPQTADQYWEQGPIFAALNTNKKSLTIDSSDAAGRELLHRFVATCDVVIENYTPRVIDQLGLSYESLREARADLIMVRMPGFGLDGEWRDLPAFAFVIEDAAGLTWMTGHPDRLPLEPYCVGDPNAGLHAVMGLLLALEHRDRTGEGGLVEVAMVDAALNIAAEQVVEHSAHGALLQRGGNRGPAAAPQNLYQAAPPDDGRDDSWVAIAVATDEQWTGLRRALDDPAWAAEEALATAAGRAVDHDRIDAELGAWCRARAAGEIVDRLWEAGVPVAEMMQPHDQPEVEQLGHRGFFEELDHPLIGPARYSTLPMSFASVDGPCHRHRAPLLGEHNEELLSGIGLDPAEFATLEADGVIGNRMRVKEAR